MTDSSPDCIQLQRDQSILLITLNNPSRLNAFSVSMRDRLTQALTEAVNDSAIRAIVLTGAGKSFCSGGDVSGMGEPRTMLQSRARMAEYHKIVRLIAEGPKPVIAAVEGHAFGLGMSLAAACDYVVAASNARFCAAFARLGLFPDVGMLWSLPRRVGSAKAKELITLAEEIDGKTAEKLGLVNKAVVPHMALSVAMEVARRYAAAAPLAFALTKASFADGTTDSLDQALRAEVDFVPVLTKTRDHAEAVSAFKEKRSAVFSGQD